MYQLRTTELFDAEAEGVEFSPKAVQGKEIPFIQLSKLQEREP